LEYEPCGLDKADLHREIERRAEKSRLPNQSRQQAYAAVLATPEGKELYKAMRAAPPAPPTAPQEMVVRDSKPEPTDAERELDRLARDVSRVANISLARAKGRILQSPQHQRLVRALMADEQRATRAVRDARDPIWRAQEELEQNWRVGRSPGSRRI
jgi:hypothetical protein